MQKHIKKKFMKVKKNMAGKIVLFIRELKLPLSILILMLGVISFIFGALYYLMGEEAPDLIYTTIGVWNAYLLGAGFIMLLTGVIYVYGFIRDKKFIIEELQTNKRSEFQKVHLQIKNKVKKMPKKYQQMLHDKEKELKIK